MWTHLHRLDAFLKQASSVPSIIVIYGPTACGKTALSLDVARRLDSEIISVDARQIYRGMDIGTGKITPEEMGTIRHHMLDVIDPSEKFSAVQFRNIAMPILENLWQQKKIPILCGGTGLYIDSLIYERTYPANEADWDMREELEAFRIAHGNEALWKKLEAIDPEYAKTLHPNNYRYVMRGIEVYTKTGQSKSTIIDTPKLKYHTLFLTPYDGDREKLYSRIDTRVAGMFDSWLIEEVEYIIREFTSLCPGLTTIGYREVVEYLEWAISLERSIELIQQHSRNYAKRQITWNKKYE